nr:hypothetical protein [Tanacetum cinerariifolium]
KIFDDGGGVVVMIYELRRGGKRAKKFSTACLSPPSTPLESPPNSPMAPPGFSSRQLLNTPKSAPPTLTSLPLAPSQPSKQTSPFAINLEPVELIFTNSPHSFFDSLKDLQPRTTNTPPP